MRGFEIKSGDEVFYCDKDRVQWGPWKVVQIAGEEVTVMINERISYSIDAGLVQKAEPQKIAV